jgi:hypothetical protein
MKHFCNILTLNNSLVEEQFGFQMALKGFFVSPFFLLR